MFSMMLYAIILVILFISGYVILKGWFPKSEGLFDWYVIGWIVILLLAAGPKKWMSLWEAFRCTFIGLC